MRKISGGAVSVGSRSLEVMGARKNRHTRETPLLVCVFFARLVLSCALTSKRLLRMVGSSEVGEGKREELAFD